MMLTCDIPFPETRQQCWPQLSPSHFAQHVVQMIVLPSQVIPVTTLPQRPFLIHWPDVFALPLLDVEEVRYSPNISVLQYPIRLAEYRTSIIIPLNRSSECLLPPVGQCELLSSFVLRGGIWREPDFWRIQDDLLEPVHAMPTN